ncbi:MAG: hypothetical protein U9Q74_01415 [Gemmatimonadota bacterium]|nr:hypothetical protein [Gemmatimonadota bacterium]
MIPLYAVICEHQRAGQAGTIDLLGIFDRIAVPNVPAQHRGATFVVQIVTDDEADLGKHDFVVRIIRPTGKPLLEQRAVFQLRPEGGSWLAAGRLAFEFHGLLLPDLGKYLFSLDVDGTPFARYAMTVVQAPAK